MPENGRSRGDEGVKVWDAPVRLFHWAIAALVVTSVVTGKIGGNAMEYHEASGFAVVTLVAFRIVWGFAGGTHARFSNFVRGPAAAVRYGAAILKGPPPFHPGHNPLGGWMVLALLACLALQAGTGLFANDDIMLEGPLARHVTKETSDLLTRIHHTNLYVLLGLVAAHVGAAFFYLLVKRENLIGPMITGRKRLPAGVAEAQARGGSLWLAAALVGLSAAGLWMLLRL